MSNRDCLTFQILTPFCEYEVFQPARKGAEEAARALDVNVRFSGPRNGDLNDLSEMVERAVEERIDGIALNIVDARALSDAVAFAAENSVPLIAFNVDDRSVRLPRLSAIGQNMHAAGQILASEIRERLAHRDKVLVTMHDPGISALEERKAGMQAALSELELDYTELVTTTDAHESMRRVGEALNKEPDIRAALGTGRADTEAIGRIVERDFAGRGIVAAGFDTSPDILRLVKSGLLDCTIDQHVFAQGYYAVTALALLARHGIAPAFVNTGASIIRRENVAEVERLIDAGYR